MLRMIRALTRLTGRIAAGIARQIDDGAVHAASTLDGARMVLASWCMTIEEIRDDPEQPATGQSAHLAHGDGRDYGDEDLIRLGRRHADGRALFDRATWTPPKTKLSLMAMRAMDGGMGM